jgi:hypothetical protein
MNSALTSICIVCIIFICSKIKIVSCYFLCKFITLDFVSFFMQDKAFLSEERFYLQNIQQHPRLGFQ